MRVVFEIGLWWVLLKLVNHKRSEQKEGYRSNKTTESGVAGEEGVKQDSYQRAQKLDGGGLTCLSAPG